MDFEEAVSDVLNSGDNASQLTPSEEVYLEFRGQIEPGLFDTGFDLLPAKSRPFGYTDQTLRSHLLSGSAFAARLNYGLRRLDDSAALSNEDLRRAMALFTVHDLHKSEEAQNRRATAQERRDADKDIQESELNQYLSRLGLRELETGLNTQDFMAAALATESGSGRHRGATSRTYTRLRPWLRLMDAAASTDSPSDAEDLERRLSEISEEVELFHHRLNDTKGITTNFLTSAVSSYVENGTSAVPVVYFTSGAIYLSPTEEELTAEVDWEESSEDLTTQFLDTIQSNVSEASDIGDIRQTLTDKLNYGFMEFSRPTYLLYGLEHADKALKSDLSERMSGEPKLYSQYKLGTIVAYAAGIVDNLPSDWRTGQAATVYLSTLYTELFDPLNGENTEEAIESMAEALGVTGSGEFLTSLEDWEYNGDLTEKDKKTLADHLDVSVDTIEEEIEDDINVQYVKRFATVITLSYLDSGSDGSLVGLSLEGSLDHVGDRLIGKFEDWDESWDSNLGRDWNADMPTEDKSDAFLDTKIATIREAIHQYITDTVVLFGRQLGQGPSSKTKLDQYTSQYQPHICLLCNSVLAGSRSKSDFETSQDTIGLSMRFSHLNEITAEGGEPDSLACPLCEIEMVIRSSVHDFSDADGEFLFLAPDYFYAPADIRFQRTVRDYLFASDGYNLLQVAQSLANTKPDSRSIAVTEILSILSPDDDSESFQNSLKSYDSSFEDLGSLGVFRLDPPRRDVGSRDPVTRIPRQILSLATATVFSWFTSSRVLLTSRPIPTTKFDEYDEMVKGVDLAAEIKAKLGDTATIAHRRDIDLDANPPDIHCYVSPDNTSRETSSSPNAGVGDDAAQESGQAADPANIEDNQSDGANSVERYTISPSTELEEWIYRFAGLLTVTFRAHGTEVQRLKSTISSMQAPFPGATSILKGNETVADYGALNAANLLDNLTNPSMSDKIDDLAEAGFETVRPAMDSDSNYNYERLFRVARDAVSDNIMQNASRDELETIVAGKVMKAAARAEDSQEFAEEGIKREPAERFAEIFINDVLYGICDGDFYQLRRHENSLAAGYNAAIRRQQAESFADNED